MKMDMPYYICSLSNTVKYFRALKERQSTNVSAFYFCYCYNWILSADLNLTIEKEFFYKRYCSVISKNFAFELTELDNILNNKITVPLKKQS